MSDPTPPPPTPQDGPGNGTPGSPGQPAQGYTGPASGYPSYGESTQEYGQQYGQGQPLGQLPYPGAGGQEKPSLLMRFLARLVDNIALAVVAGIINSVLLVSIIGVTRGGSPSYGMGTGVGNAYAYSALSGVISALLALAYFVGMETRNNGQTLGKLITKLRVLGPAGGPPTVEESVRRNFWVALGILAVVPFLGLLGSLAELVIVIVIAVTISGSPTGEGWHDRLAHGTRVVPA